VRGARSERCSASERNEYVRRREIERNERVGLERLECVKQDRVSKPISLLHALTERKNVKTA
jgi:hypothetical protein